MSEETVPQQGGSTAAAPPKGLLQQMEELMAALNADLSDLEIKSGFSAKASTSSTPSTASAADQPRSDGYTRES
ncbi:hypothetical protein SAMN04487983_1013119 [Streptomyces sp. yr375]|uniref:hypothetical protein n=1 Tax=Streptomyces sp. yr375 TaxID=1761906 RepID=UPI0008C7AA03|nr:hypothetical protein [Streptomyces sp. yr375]SER26055.1 hypothetical protein SAMN04487983_1013119 [Streptomyces sp. yr375]